MGLDKDGTLVCDKCFKPAMMPNVGTLYKCQACGAKEVFCVHCVLKHIRKKHPVDYMAIVLPHLKSIRQSKKL